MDSSATTIQTCWRRWWAEKQFRNRAVLSAEHDLECSKCSEIYPHTITFLGEYEDFLSRCPKCYNNLLRNQMESHT